MEMEKMCHIIWHQSNLFNKFERLGNFATAVCRYLSKSHVTFEMSKTGKSLDATIER